MNFAMKYVPGTYNTNHLFTLELVGLVFVLVLITSLIIWYIKRRK